jgi:hypothetical protein
VGKVSLHIGEAWVAAGGAQAPGRQAARNLHHEGLGRQLLSEQGVDDAVALEQGIVEADTAVQGPAEAEGELDEVVAPGLEDALQAVISETVPQPRRAGVVGRGADAGGGQRCLRGAQGRGAR